MSKSATNILKAAGAPITTKNLTKVGPYANTIEKSLKNVLKMIGISKKNNKK
jgi:hypothetical protein